MSKSTAVNNLHQLDFVNLNNFNQKDLLELISICVFLKKRQERDSFMKWFLIGNEKWILYNSVMRKRSREHRDEPLQTTSETWLLPDRSCSQFSSIGMVWCSTNFFQLTPRNQPNSHFITLQEKVHEFINCKGIVFHHDKCALYTTQIYLNAEKLTASEMGSKKVLDFNRYFVIYFPIC